MPSGCVLAGLLLALERRWGFVPLHEVGRKVHCRRGEIPETDGGQTAPRPGQCQRHCGVLQGFNTLFILLPICRKSGTESAT